MKTIYKFELQITDEQSLDVPVGYQVLSVAVQNETLYMWVMVDTENIPTEMTVRIYGTGYNIPPLRTNVFIGTVLMSGGSLVWHVFVKALA